MTEISIISIIIISISSSIIADDSADVAADILQKSPLSLVESAGEIADLTMLSLGKLRIVPQ